MVQIVWVSHLSLQLSNYFIYSRKKNKQTNKKLVRKADNSKRGRKNTSDPKLIKIKSHSISLKGMESKDPQQPKSKKVTWLWVTASEMEVGPTFVS